MQVIDVVKPRLEYSAMKTWSYSLSVVGQGAAPNATIYGSGHSPFEAAVDFCKRYGIVVKS